MLWKGRDESENVEDRRGMSGGRGLAVGGGAVGVVITIIYVLLGGNPADLKSTGAGASQPYVETPADKERAQFVRVVLADTEKVWKSQFSRLGKTYVDPRLVLFSESIDSACGFASAASGPFYCPEDQKVYIDLSFYDLLSKRFGAGGDFAQAYVIAHEVGHHVQNLLGTMKNAGGDTGASSASVRLELQADFYAGVWAHYAQSMEHIDENDIREAVQAATAIGDDAIQRQTEGRVVPDSFTHGTSEQRVRWFMKGWQTGDVKQGDTFHTDRL